jgi:predicted AlkP superfamily phosphohydrolase/phosphomutase
MTRKLLILGIDGMDSATTSRLVSEGKMPNTATFIKRGASARGLKMLGALPTITPPCWTTLATGAWPSTHGITCYFRQSPDSLDAVLYNMDSAGCSAEQLWNVTSERGMKTLVWHWPGASWPPTSDSPLLHVVDGTQPGSVNMGISQMDWEKIVTVSSAYDKLRYIPHTEKSAGIGCNITDLEEVLGALPDTGDDEIMELWWGDKARESGVEIRTYVNGNEDTETFIGSKVAYDAVYTPFLAAEGFNEPPEGARAFVTLVSGGAEPRHGLFWKRPEDGRPRVRLYGKDKDAGPIVEFGDDEIAFAADEVTKSGKSKPSVRGYKILEVSRDGGVRFWMSNALDITNDTLWHPKALYGRVTGGAGPVPPVSLIGGENAELVRSVFIPSWDVYNKWQANALNDLIKHDGYDVVFSHLHNIDCAGHQFWHFGKTLKEWSHTDEAVYRGFIDDVYVRTDKYLGEFLYLLDEGWTIFVVSDHGLLIGENVPPLLGEYGGLNVPIMESLGYTTLKRDADGNKINEVDFERTTAVQIRSNYVCVNLAGRDAHGIVAPSDKYDLEDKIISDLYNYRDPGTGRRVVGIALRNKDAIALGVGGAEAGDIFFTIEEGFNRLHGDGLSTAEGYAGTSAGPVFIAAGVGIKEGFTAERVIRQADVAVTAAHILGVRPPAQSEGGIIHQLLNGYAGEQIKGTSKDIPVTRTGNAGFLCPTAECGRNF